ncbi:MAG: succinylglutamate desuccinylase, partial [Alphaproteobacteria bacterium]|nr:succinylglutamate desuccinylase [Alphaproteobacteria bacterium]
MPAAWAVELEPVDLAAWAAGNTGVPYAWSFVAKAPGPHLLINALTHGNELCGAHALTFLLDHDVRPRRGRLSLSFANVAAYAAFDPADPEASRCLDEDFNRLWGPGVLDGPPRTRERIRARMLRPLYAAADHLLDLHSMVTPSPPMLLSGLLPKNRALAAAIGAPAVVVADAGHVAGVRLRDFAGFDDPASPKTAVLVECGQHWASGSAVVAREVCLRFLNHFAVLDPAFVAAHLSPEPPPPQRTVEVTHAVTVASSSFRFVRPVIGLETIVRAGTMIADDGGEAVTTPYDGCVLVMPSRDVRPGQTAVRFGRIAAV